MKIKRAAALPLITHDPFFSIWCGTNHPAEGDTIHWSGLPQPLRASLTVEGEYLTLLGDPGEGKTMEHTGTELTATGTVFSYENEAVRASLSFVSPLLLSDLPLLARPVSYVKLRVERKRPCPVRFRFTVGEKIASRNPCPMAWLNWELPGEEPIAYASMGRRQQEPLKGSGDKLTIDWGYAYLASPAAPGLTVRYEEGEGLTAVKDLGEKEEEILLAVAYDDLVSMNYFGDFIRGYWTKFDKTILGAIENAMRDREEVLKRCESFDREMEERAKAAGGADYAYLCLLAYRQSIAAHKLIADKEGELLFLSKENDSNGCVGTVDVSYPSSPLYLLYAPELVKGLLRPVFRFASLPVWEFDFAPHDVGRYPYAWGQVYSLSWDPIYSGQAGYSGKPDEVNPPTYMYPPGSGVYAVKDQMPVEECGNMILMTAAVCELEGSGEFAKPYLEILRTWTRYLTENGADPGEQLCTDDFAGHLAHNVNLSVKAVMGIEGFARILDLLGEKTEAAAYHAKAAALAADVEQRAYNGHHYVLAYGREDSFSLKYNSAWDRFFGSGLFSEDFYARELAVYQEKAERYGTPLDVRASYTKSDWVLWCAALTGDKEVRQALIGPVARYQEETKDRYPFSDWYDTKSGDHCAFKGRSVQGGIFMPMLMDVLGKK